MTTEPVASGKPTCDHCGLVIFWGWPRPDDPCPECGNPVRKPPEVTA